MGSDFDRMYYQTLGIVFNGGKGSGNHAPGQGRGVGKPSNSVKISSGQPSWRPSVKIENHLSFINKKAKSTSTEYLRICDKDGNLLIDKKGDKNHVSFHLTDEEIQDTVSSHNHPTKEIDSTFSYLDIEQFSKGMKQTRAVTKNVIFSLTDIGDSSTKKIRLSKLAEDFYKRFGNHLRSEVVMERYEPKDYEKYKDFESKVKRKFVEMKKEYERKMKTGLPFYTETFLRSSYNELEQFKKDSLSQLNKMKLQTQRKAYRKYNDAKIDFLNNSLNYGIEFRIDRNNS